jgi:hypothetical protein
MSRLVADDRPSPPQHPGKAMPISIGCSKCDKQLTIDDKFAGKRIKCPKCEGVISVPAADEDDRPSRRGGGDEIAEKPRGRSSPDRREEEDDRPSRRVSRDDRDDRDDDRGRGRSAPRDRDRDDYDDDRRSRKDKEEKGGRDAFAFDDDKGVVSTKSKKKKKGGKLWLWLGLGGGGVVLLLSTCVCGGVLWYFDLIPGLGGSISAESKYFPDDVNSVSSTRVSQIRSTRLHKEGKGKGGMGLVGLFMMGGGELHGLREEEVDRITNATSSKGEQVTIITTTKSLKPDELKNALKPGGFGFGGGGMEQGGGEYIEEKAGGYSLFVRKNKGGGGIEFSFCVPESRIIICGQADHLRKILRRDKKPELPETFRKAYNGADFSNSAVTVVGGQKGFGGGIGGGKAKAEAEATCMQINYGSSMSIKVTAYFKDSETAERARREAEDEMKNEKVGNSDVLKELRRNARVSKSGSSVTVSTSVREETILNEKNPGF